MVGNARLARACVCVCVRACVRVRVRVCALGVRKGRHLIGFLSASFKVALEEHHALIVHIPFVLRGAEQKAICLCAS